jgi:GNAT superfamily N-acetyltransferase
MSEELGQLRERLGASASLWAGPEGVTFQARGWTALSGVRSVDYNVVLCAGDGDELDAGVERVLTARVPTVVMVAGPALGEVQRLVARDWVCIGATPLMTRELGTGRPGPPLVPAPSARRLDDALGLAAARALVDEVFEIGPELAQLALPAPTSGAEISHELWGAFDDAGELQSCLALVRVRETVAVWSMATAAAVQGQGYGRRALEAALIAATAAGAERVVLYASPAGEPFYRRLSFREAERWQMWSRPRWVLGRA